MTTPTPSRQPWHRRDLPWWGWAFFFFVRIWTLIMTLVSLAVVVVAVLMFLWVAKHPGRTDLTPFFRSLAKNVGVVADTLGATKR